MGRVAMIVRMRVVVVVMMVVVCVTVAVRMARVLGTLFVAFVGGHDRGLSLIPGAPLSRQSASPVGAQTRTSVMMPFGNISSGLA